MCFLLCNDDNDDHHDDDDDDDDIKAAEGLIFFVAVENAPFFTFWLVIKLSQQTFFFADRISSSGIILYIATINVCARVRAPIHDFSRYNW